ALTLGDVSTEQFVNAPNEFFEKHFRQFVPLERRIEQQTLKVRIQFVMLERTEGESLKHRAIVLQLERLRDHLFRIHRVSAAGFVIKNGGVEFLFGREMA